MAFSPAKLLFYLPPLSLYYALPPADCSSLALRPELPHTNLPPSIGGGIMGCTTAYYLTRHPKFDPALHSITILEATSIAAGASGKAGGLLALWAYPACLVPLSYRLHAELAREHGGPERWGYRRVACGTLTAAATDEDLERAEAARAKTVATLNGNANPVESQTAALPDAPAGGDVKAEPPIQNADGEEKSKDWEKLPKQNEEAASSLKDSPLPADLDWIDSSLIKSYTEMGMAGTRETSQVHPFYFTTAMAELAKEKGVDIKLMSKVTQINHSKAGIRSVEYEDREAQSSRIIDGVTDVVVSAGPWTGKVLPRTKVEGLRAHSVVFEADVSPHAVFTDIQLPTDWAPEHRASKGQRRKHKGNVDPEIYARPGGEVYACGEPDRNVPLPETADLVQTDRDQCDDLASYIATVSPRLAAAPLKARQACYLPRHIRFSEEHSPLVGPTSVPGLWVAAGHTCWGIQNGPATGCLMAEMLFDGEATSADIRRLDPRKFKV